MAVRPMRDPSEYEDGLFKWPPQRRFRRAWREFWRTISRSEHLAEEDV